jgi:hypothetical protein
MKRWRISFGVMGALALSAFVAACGDPNPPQAAELSYEGNSNTGGSAPAGGSYLVGDSVTVLGNSGALARTGYSFVGWNTQPFGNGTPYAAGAKISLKYTATTLYADWLVDPDVNGDRVIHYDGDPATSCGPLYPVPECLVYFNKAKLHHLADDQLKSISIYYGQDPDYDQNFTIRLYNGVGGDYDTPGAKIFEVVHTMVSGWNDIALPSPVTINTDTELWAGYYLPPSDGINYGWPCSYSGGQNGSGTSMTPSSSSSQYSRLDSLDFYIRLLIGP